MQGIFRRTRCCGTNPFFVSAMVLGFAVTAVERCAAQPEEPATIKAAAAVLDLAEFPLPQGAICSEPRRLAQLSYFCGDKPAAAFGHVKEHLVQSQWEEMEGGYHSDEFASGTYFKNGFLVSVSAIPGTDPDGKPATNVRLQQHGNVLLDTVPRPANLEKVYAGPASAIYVSGASVEETASQCAAALAKNGWTIYSSDTEPRQYKRNAVRLTVFTASAPAQQGKTSVTYTAELMSADLDPPPETTRIDYADSIATLHFDSRAPLSDVIAFYQKHLAGLGWKATTNHPIRIDLHDTLIFRNAAKALLELKVSAVEEGLTRGSLALQTAAEVEALDKAVAEKLRANAADEAMQTEADAATIVIPLPADASEVEVAESQIDFLLPSGKSAAPIKALRKFFVDQGWTEKVLSDDATARIFSYHRDEASIQLSCVDPGFIPADVALRATGVVLTKK